MGRVYTPHIKTTSDNSISTVPYVGDQELNNFQLSNGNDQRTGNETYLPPRHACSTTAYSMVSLTATARLAGSVHGVVVHTATAKPSPSIWVSNAGGASVTYGRHYCSTPHQKRRGNRKGRIDAWRHDCTLGVLQISARTSSSKQILE